MLILLSECLIPCYFSYLKIVWWNLNEKMMGGSRVIIRRIAATLANSLNFRYRSRALLCKYKILSINC